MGSADLLDLNISHTTLVGIDMRRITLRRIFHPGTPMSRENDHSILDADVWTETVAQNCMMSTKETMTAVPVTECVTW